MACHVATGLIGWNDKNSRFTPLTANSKYLILKQAERDTLRNYEEVAFYCRRRVRESRLHQAGAVLRLVRGKNTLGRPIYIRNGAPSSTASATSSLAYTCTWFADDSPFCQRSPCGTARWAASRLRDYPQDVHTQSFASRHPRDHTGGSVNFDDLVTFAISTNFDFVREIVR